MVQNVKLIFHGHARGFQLGEGTDNVAVFHVSSRVIVGTNHKDSGMTTMCCLNEVVEIQKIVVVPGQEHLTLTGTRRQVTGIRGAS